METKNVGRKLHQKQSLNFDKHSSVDEIPTNDVKYVSYRFVISGKKRKRETRGTEEVRKCAKKYEKCLARNNEQLKTELPTIRHLPR